MKKSIYATALAASAVLALAACGAAPEDTKTSGSAASGSASADFKACMVSDAGGFDDKSFNQSGAEGLDAAVKELGIQEAKAQSQSDADFAPNVDSMVQQGCNLTIGVGFLLEDAIQAAADANPDANFALIDSAFSGPDFKPVELKNAKPILFNTAEASYLAGYLAAGMSQTGTVATFGGMQIPSVSIFMDGFADGVAKYNEDNGGDVQLLGWDKAAQNGSFSGDFDNQAQGQTLTEGFIAQGADIIMPVAGPVGLGAAAAAESANKGGGDVKIVGVDKDWYESNPEFGSLYLTSVVKEIGQAVTDTVTEAADGKFSAEPYVGTLDNKGVGLAPFHDFDAKVPQELKDKVTELQKQIVSGDIKVETPNAP
ncbi:BMP family protein [Georgenia sp. SYP-B2076]|uniref:BMP family lipoprotein n=1 Tax=Georgenia sp. SYP-B2076 TaxID=2495881 RepID=UPI001F0CDA6F|nr:BMP family ABC transporter substrate-binding protein [Georgenia sp. SYP-B2076]